MCDLWSDGFATFVLTSLTSTLGALGYLFCVGANESVLWHVHAFGNASATMWS